MQLVRVLASNERTTNILVDIFIPNIDPNCSLVFLHQNTFDFTELNVPVGETAPSTYISIFSVVNGILSEVELPMHKFT